MSASEKLRRNARAFVEKALEGLGQQLASDEVERVVDKIVLNIAPVLDADCRGDLRKRSENLLVVERSSTQPRRA